MVNVSDVDYNCREAYNTNSAVKEIKPRSFPKPIQQVLHCWGLHRRTHRSRCWTFVRECTKNMSYEPVYGDTLKC